MNWINPDTVRDGARLVKAGIPLTVHDMDLADKLEAMLAAAGIPCEIEDQGNYYRFTPRR